MTQPDTPHTRIRDEINRRMAVARAATPGPWGTSGPDTIAEWSIYAVERGWLVASAEVNDYPDSPFPKLRGGITGDEANRNAAFMATFNPAAILAWLEGELETLERHAPTDIDAWRYGITCKGCPNSAVSWPCAEIRSLAHRLGVSVDG